MFKYMDMAFEKEQQEAEKDKFETWLNHMSRTFTQSHMGDPGTEFKNAKKEFEGTISPFDNVPSQKELAWDFEKKS